MKPFCSTAYSVLALALFCTPVVNARTVAPAPTPVAVCPSDLSRCEVSGYSQQPHEKPVYVLSCADQPDTSLEFKEGSTQITVRDLVSLSPLAQCSVAAEPLQASLQRFLASAHRLEAPLCFLTQWKGQMTYVLGKNRGRCSFQMNATKAAGFQSATGVSALYQCEGDYFLTAASQNSGSKIYRPTATGWEMACEAPLRVGDKVEDIDWQHPPDYYQP